MVHMESNPHIELVPTLASELREEVERLFFFNPRQPVFEAGIRASVEKHGIPQIMEQDGRIWIGVPSGTTQCLFACDLRHEPARLAGVVIYARPTPSTLCITHLAVDPDYAVMGGDASFGLGMVLVGAVRQVARRMNGVISLQLPYRSRAYLPVVVPQTSPLQRMNLKLCP
jgi:hypothetical protein